MKLKKKITKNLILGPFQALSSRLRKKECSKKIWLPGPILESKGMRAIFSEKAQKKKRAKKKGQIFENWSKNVQNLIRPRAPPLFSHYVPLIAWKKSGKIDWRKTMNPLHLTLNWGQTGILIFFGFCFWL